MAADIDPELQPILARHAYEGLMFLCDSCVPGMEIAVDDVGAILRLIHQACTLDEGPGPT